MFSCLSRALDAGRGELMNRIFGPIWRWTADGFVNLGEHGKSYKPRSSTNDFKSDLTVQRGEVPFPSTVARSASRTPEIARQVAREVGQRLKAARRERRVAQDAFAKAMGFSRT